MIRSELEKREITDSVYLENKIYVRSREWNKAQSRIVVEKRNKIHLMSFAHEMKKKNDVKM